MIDEPDLSGDPLVPVSDADWALAPPPARTKLLTPQDIRRIGAMQIVEIRDTALEQFCDQQRRTYERLPPERLVELLVERDRGLALEGRQLADGRIQGRLLREFVRGVLSYADHAALRRVGDATRTGKIEEILKALGAEPADLRQIRLHGTTLGPEETEEEYARRMAEKAGDRSLLPKETE